MISPKISQIWIGPHTEESRGCTAAMQAMNHDMEYKLWGNEILDRFSTDPYVKKLQSEGENIAFICDRLRVLLLRDDGGIYVDADCRAIRPFSTLKCLTMPHVDFVAGLRNPHRPGVALHRGVALLDNTVLASAPNGRMVNLLCDLYKPGNKQWLQNGVSMGHEIMRNCDETTVILGHEHFYADKPTSKTIVLHDTMNFASWLQHPEHQIPRLVAV